MKALALALLPSLVWADAVAPPAGGALHKEALGLVAAWVEAQNRGDAAAYASFYDPQHFKGVKRTARGGKKVFDYPGWIADRTAMLKKRPKVEASSPSVATWEEQRGRLKPGVIAVRFMQRWKSERYADHGVKVLHLLRGAQGKLLILYEDLLSSEAGWDAQAAGVAKLVLTPPASDEAAVEVWRKIGPTGATVAQTLEAIPGQPSVTRPLARTLLGGGRFACDKVVRVSECGDEQVSWEELDPKAGIDDPCLRRRLAVWALTRAGLTEQDVKSLGDELEGLLALGEPEEELPRHLLELVDPMSTATRLRFLHKAPAELAEQHLDGLPARAIAELYRDDHLDAAALKLDAKRDRELVIAGLTDDKLKVETRKTLLGSVGELRGADVTAGLVAVAEGAADCALAMDAALALEARGDKSYLPRRPKVESEPALSRALCMLVHDPDAARQLARYKELLPPRGRVKVVEEIEDEFARDDEGRRVDTSPKPDYFTRKSVDSFNIDADFGTVAKGGRVDTSDGWYEVSFAAGKDGKLYIAEIHRYRWRGCPC